MHAVAGVAFALAVTLCGSASADELPLVATMSCERVSSPGRVKCSIEAKATGGRSMSWADVAIVELPAFTTALKGRIGPSDATASDASAQRWAFGIIARKLGQGTLKARVRAVVCEAADAAPERCAPVTVTVEADVHAG